MTSQSLFDSNEYAVHCPQTGEIIGFVWASRGLWLARKGSRHLPPSQSQNAAVRLVERDSAVSKPQKNQIQLW